MTYETRVASKYRVTDKNVLNFAMKTA